MPQVFGSAQVDLMNRVSMWVEAADLQGDPKTSDLFGQFLDQEGFGDRETPVNEDQRRVARGRLTYTKDLGVKTIRNPKTMKDQPPKYSPSGQLLNGDGYHELVVHLDPRVSEGAKETSVGGPRRYELSYHHVNRNGDLNAMSIWSGNTPHGLNNAHEKIKAALGRMK